MRLLARPFSRRTESRSFGRGRKVVWPLVSKPLRKRFASVFASTPRKLSHKLLQLYPVGNDVCAISQISLPPVDATGHYVVTIFVRDGDDWKVRVSYVY